jgi:hypothetical protein
MKGLKMRFPDFFIIGAPKCGTTSLYDWLSEHPRIFMSEIKEPEYYLPEHPWGRVVSSQEMYLRLFKKAKPDQLCGEATARYLFSKTAVPAILENNPRAKLIAMVRNPVEMAPSFHTQRRWNCREGESDFATAWRDGYSRESWSSYQALCSLGEQLDRLLKVVDRSQVHVIVLDDLRDNPKAVYEQTLAFLRVKSDGRREFPVSNVRKTRRFDVLDRVIRHPPAMLAPIKRAFLSSFLLEAKRLRRKLNFLMTKPTPREPVDPALRAEMAEYFAQDVALLGRLLGRDLSHWVNV